MQIDSMWKSLQIVIIRLAVRKKKKISALAYNSNLASYLLVHRHRRRQRRHCGG